MIDGQPGTRAAATIAERTSRARLASLPGPTRTTASYAATRYLLLMVFLVLGGCTTLSETGENTPESDAYGVWAGRIPCADCPGIDVRLVLWRDPNFFRMTEIYLDATGGPKTFTAFGTWNVKNVADDPGLGRFRLVTDDARRVIQLERLPSGNLRLLDRDGEPQDPDLDYILERTRAQQD